ncbi:MAG: PEP-CTERM sorting domain-containing protein [Chthoniobacterales bacterium]
MLTISFNAAASLTVDGTRDAGYGPALSVQTVETGFGDNFSEWDAGYAKIESGVLYLMLTGNMEANFNKLNIFIDSKAGGQSVFDSSGNDNSQAMDGLVFDVGFLADYHLDIRRGTDSGNQTFCLDFADLGAQTASQYLDIMSGSGLEGTGTTGTGVNAGAILVGYNNSNIAGVGGGAPNAADQTAAAAVTTGLELAISLADLGYVSGDIRVMIGQNNQGQNYWSNQFLGGLTAPQGNLGGDGNGSFTGEGAIDFTTLAGDQFFTVAPVPEPSTYAAGIAALLAGIIVMRRRKVVRS